MHRNRLATSALLLLSTLSIPGNLRAQSPSNQDVPSQTPDQQPSAPVNQQRVWTNDNIGNVRGNISVVGGSSSQPGRRTSPRASSSGDISIISPSDGAVFKPGEVIPVEVRVTLSKTITGMGIISPLGFGNEIRKSPPWSLTLTVPTEESGMSGPLIGKQPVYVRAGGPGIQDGEAEASIIVDVEEPEIPVKLWTQMMQLQFEAVGEEWPLDIVGTFPDGLQLEVNESTRILFSSTNTDVATVSDFGMVTAVATGKAFIHATYGTAERAIQPVVPVTCEIPAGARAHYAPPPDTSK